MFSVKTKTKDAVSETFVDKKERLTSFNLEETTTTSHIKKMVIK